MAPSSSRRRVGLGSIVGFVAIFFFGLVLFQRMWTFHAALSLAQGNAAHLERLYGEAMEEAADWRIKYDVDLRKETEARKDLEAKIELLQKVNRDFEQKIDALKMELLEEKRKCETAEQAQGNGSAADKVS